MDFIWFRPELTSNRHKLESEKKKKSSELACWFQSRAGATALEPHPLFPDDFQVDWKKKKKKNEGCLENAKKPPP